VATNDTAARVFAEGLAKRWNKPIVVDNKPGGDASIGTGLFASARDDHTLLYGTASVITVNPLVQNALPCDSARDLVPLRRPSLTSTEGRLREVHSHFNGPNRARSGAAGRVGAARSASSSDIAGACNLHRAKAGRKFARF
jgi:hypothetical protein